MYLNGYHPCPLRTIRFVQMILFVFVIPKVWSMMEMSIYPIFLESNAIIIAVCENDVGSRENISKIAKSILRRSKVTINNKRNNCWEYKYQ